MPEVWIVFKVYEAGHSKNVWGVFDNVEAARKETTQMNAPSTKVVGIHYNYERYPVCKAWDRKDMSNG